MSADNLDFEINSYLTFRLENEVYALNTANVLHILEMQKITKVPKAPDYILGVINLRGAVIPVIDTRKKFELPGIELTSKTCILVLELILPANELIIGTMVDEVSEVIEIQEKDIKPPPAIGDNYRAEFIEGVAVNDDGFILILDLEKLLTGDEITKLTTTSNKYKGEVESVG